MLYIILGIKDKNCAVTLIHFCNLVTFMGKQFKFLIALDPVRHQE